MEKPDLILLEKLIAAGGIRFYTIRRKIYLKEKHFILYEVACMLFFILYYTFINKCFKFN